MWLSASGDVLEPARGHQERPQKQTSSGEPADRQLVRAFARAARGPVTVPADLSSLLQAALVRRITELLGLARRAGQAIAGFEKAREYLRASQSRLVLQASDGSVAERARFLSGAAPDLMVFDPLTGETMGRVFGRDYVVHVALAPGKLAESLAVEAGRLAGLRSRSAGTEASEAIGGSTGAMGSQRIMGSAGATERATAPVNTVLGANG
jgi:ribosomal protein L30E